MTNKLQTADQAARLKHPKEIVMANARLRAAHSVICCGGNEYN